MKASQRHPSRLYCRSMGRAVGVVHQRAIHPSKCGGVGRCVSVGGVLREEKGLVAIVRLFGNRQNEHPIEVKKKERSRGKGRDRDRELGRGTTGGRD